MDQAHQGTFEPDAAAGATGAVEAVGAEDVAGAEAEDGSVDASTLLTTAIKVRKTNATRKNFISCFPLINSFPSFLKISYDFLPAVT
jgi:hypothetical protein